MSEPSPRPFVRARITVMNGSLPALAAVALLVALRLTVQQLSGRPFSVGELVTSLAFELVLLVAAFWAGWAGRGGRWISAGIVWTILWLNVAGTAWFVTVRAYGRGFQLGGLPLGEQANLALSHFSPIALLLLAGVTVIAAGFPRLSRVVGLRPRLFTVAATGALAGGAAFLTLPLYQDPDGSPVTAHSPIVYLLATRQTTPELLDLPTGVAHPEDWAPVTSAEPAWDRLAAMHPAKNVILLVLESMRADAFWPANKDASFPVMEALAPEAAVFTHAYAHEPLSIKSMEALFFGVYPVPAWEPISWHRANIALDSAPARWGALGMRRFFIMNGDARYDGQERLVTARGMQVFDERNTPSLGLDRPDRNIAQTLETALGPTDPGRFGAILWTRNTHSPYVLPAPYQNRFPPNSAEAYRAAAVTADDVVGDLVAMLKRRHLYESTVIVIVGDHGEELGEHPLSGMATHGSWPYEESVRVPLIFVNPELFHGERDDRIVQLKDLAPTVTWLAGDPRPNLNLGGCVFFHRSSPAAYLVDFLGGMRGALVLGPLKYQYAHWEFRGGPTSDALFDLEHDPGEKQNLWSTRRAEGEVMKSRYFGWLHDYASRWVAIGQGERYRNQSEVEAYLTDPTRHVTLPPGRSGIGAMSSAREL